MVRTLIATATTPAVHATYQRFVRRYSMRTTCLPFAFVPAVRFVRAAAYLLLVCYLTGWFWLHGAYNSSATTYVRSPPPPTTTTLPVGFYYVVVLPDGLRIPPVHYTAMVLPMRSGSLTLGPCAVPFQPRSYLILRTPLPVTFTVVTYPFPAHYHSSLSLPTPAHRTTGGCVPSF